MPKDRLQRGLRATFLGIAVNVVLGAAKFLAGIFGHSHALIADATESFADIFNSLVVWRGIVVAAAPPDEDHPYGHSKAEPLAGAFGAVMLLAAAIWFSLVTWLMKKTRSLGDCIVAHATTNLLLGCYVLYSGEWTLL